jgi:hypothetical protein
MPMLRQPGSRAISVVAMLLILLAVAPAAISQPHAAPPAAATAPSVRELVDVRKQLLDLMRMSPTLTTVVETDPSLLADQEYVGRNNPQLAQFLTQHPEVTRNPDFYLFANLGDSREPGAEPLHRRVNGYATPSAAEERRQSLDMMLQPLIFIVVVGSLMWLIRILLENRRWGKVFRMQSEVHGKLLDRFAHSEELLQYMSSEPGKRFLEAAPIPIEFERDQRLPGGLARVLPQLQIGIVLTLLGLGLLLLHRSVTALSEPLLVFGTIVLMPGLGFILSAGIAWRISERLGLMPERAAPSTPPNDRQ